jgi:two-component system, chemotaxis family, CheB/CheR fusion protein
MAGSDDDDTRLRLVLVQLLQHTGHDFASYRRVTVLRRVQHRARLAGQPNLADYADRLRNDAGEAHALLGDLLLSITRFFRDPPAFAALATYVIPRLFDNRAAADPIRVWAPGCATGEEVYSIGILLLEEASLRDVSPTIQLLGSDLEPSALSVAHQGRYPAAIEGDVSQERLQRYFVREGDHYQVKSELRDIVQFRSHSLLRDPAPSRVDLISCRNLLIYLERDQQRQVIAAFHEALSPNGYLFLGPSERAEHPAALFRPIDRASHIYQAVPTRKNARSPPGDL